MESGLLPELFVRPRENRLNVLFGARGQSICAHLSLASRNTRNLLRRPPANLADEIRELLITLESGSLTSVERAKRLGCKDAKDAQLLFFLLRRPFQKAQTCSQDLARIAILAGSDHSVHQLRMVLGKFYFVCGHDRQPPVPSIIQYTSGMAKRDLAARRPRRPPT
jgi:hypothetical protein